MAKLEYVRGLVNPYPERFERTHEICEVPALAEGTDGVRTAGRVMSMRKMGKMSFIHIADVYGRLQIVAKRDVLGEEAYTFLKKGFDIGDFLGVVGEVFTTQAGEKSLLAHEIAFLGKAYRPLPEKFHGITDTEICYRQRYLDLCMNEETRERFLKKSQFVKEIRRYLEDNGYTRLRRRF